MLGWFYIDLLVFEANPTQIVPQQNTDRLAQNTDRLNARGKGNHPQGTYHIETGLLMMVQCNMMISPGKKKNQLV